MLTLFKKKFIGDRDFYRRLLTIAIPIMVQQIITNFVSLLDNIMVGQIGTVQMSGVAIANQLMFVFYICVFGAVSGAGIYGAQFYGKGDVEGLRSTFQFKLFVCAVVSVVAMALFWYKGEFLIGLYLQGGSSGAAADEVLMYGMRYLRVMIIGIIPFAWTQSYASTLKETGETVLPMKAGVTAVFINLIFNYILIFGKLGAPQLGAVGAAVATVLSRFVEFFIVVIWTHRHVSVHSWIRRAYVQIRMSATLVKNIVITGTPLLINESLWAAGMAIISQCYSLRGIEAVAAQNISSTISNVFNVVFLSMGNVIGIMVGQLLGANKMEEAKDTDRKLIFFSIMSCLVIGTIMAFVSPAFPAIYKTEQIVKDYATSFLRIAALVMPINAFSHASYFTLRSGGKTILTFLFDSVFVWVVSIPVAYCLCHFTRIGIVYVVLICSLMELFKCCIGFILVKKGVWLHNIVNDK